VQVLWRTFVAAKSSSRGMLIFVDLGR
jgi:hypothetical protein